MPDQADAPHQSANLHKYRSKSRLYQWHLRAFHEALYQMLRRTDAELVLDAGCGEGFVTTYLARRDPSLRITGVDVKEDAIAYARDHFGDLATFRTGSVYKLPFSDNSFDAIVCSEVLEHLDDPVRPLDEFKRVARRHVLITVPREPYFKWLNDLGRGLRLSPDPGHVNFWTKKTFQDFINGQFPQAAFAWKHTYQLALAQV
jgi:ubiquinone/menaquinone biosynthesis C-methylase UbiE